MASIRRPGCDGEILHAVVGTYDCGLGYAAIAVLVVARDGIVAADVDPRFPFLSVQQQQQLLLPLPPGLPWTWRPWPAWTRHLPFSSFLQVGCSHYR